MIGRSRRVPTAAILVYGGAALAACLQAVLVLRLWQADLRVPFNYGGDSVFFAMVVKSVVDHPWYLTNPQLGAPGILVLHDFAQADAGHLLAFKALSWLSTDWALLINLYFLLGFPLITLSALAVLRHFRVATGPAIIASLLYAFLPSRLITGEAHLFVTAFFQVPLAVLVALWVAGDDPPVFGAGTGAWRPALALRRRRSVVALAIAVLVSLTGVYFAFFAGALILLAAAGSAVARRSPRHAYAGVVLGAVIVAGLVAQSLPSLPHRRAMGPNPVVAHRVLGEAETYALKIAPLLLPVTGHPVPALAAIKARYDSESNSSAEVASTSLGVVGALGFLILLGMLFRRPAPAASDAPERRSLLTALARLNLAALLLATTGGFGALFALLVSPLIRTYARMHVFIAFFSLFCVALLLDRLWRTRRRLGLLLTAAAAAVGFLDQLTPAARRPYAQLGRGYREEAAFVHALEAQLPAGAQIFELPYLRFPEAGDMPKTYLGDYDLLRPYLHSHSLRWSYPTMAGRSGDAWTSGVSDAPAPELVRTVSDAGFDGILVDRVGYTDGGTAVVAELAAALGPGPPPETTDRYVFFDLRAENQRAFAGLSPGERERRRQEALDRPVLHWRGGFFPPEHGPDGLFRWCPGDCTLEITNASTHEARVELSLRIAAGQPPASLQVTSHVWTETIALGPGRTPIVRALRVPVGRHPVRLRCNGAPVVAPRDPRRLVFRVEDAHLRPAAD